MHVPPTSVPTPSHVSGVRSSTTRRRARTTAAASPSARPGDNRRGPVPPVLTFVPVPEGKTVKNRLHVDLSPAVDPDRGFGHEKRLPCGSLSRGWAYQDLNLGPHPYQGCALTV